MLRDRLPHFVSSLSKYIRVEKYYELIAAISHDTPESVLRARFDENLYATAKQRYLIVRKGMVIRDKLVDFVHDEGAFTEREDGEVLSFHVPVMLAIADSSAKR